MKLSDIPKWLPKLNELAEGMKAGRKIQSEFKPSIWVQVSNESYEIDFETESPENYRVEPEPVKPREVLVLKHCATGVIGGLIFESMEESQRYMNQYNLESTHKPVKFVEVVDDK